MVEIPTRNLSIINLDHDRRTVGERILRRVHNGTGRLLNRGNGNHGLSAKIISGLGTALTAASAVPAMGATHSDQQRIPQKSAEIATSHEQPQFLRFAGMPAAAAAEQFVPSLVQFPQIIGVDELMKNAKTAEEESNNFTSQRRPLMEKAAKLAKLSDAEIAKQLEARGGNAKIISEKLTEGIGQQKKKASAAPLGSEEWKNHMINVKLYESARRFYLQLLTALPKEDGEKLGQILVREGIDEKAYFESIKQGKKSDVVATGNLAMLLSLGQAFNTLNYLDKKDGAFKTLERQDYLGDVHRTIAELDAMAKKNFAGCMKRVAEYNSTLEGAIRANAKSIDATAFVKEILPQLSGDEKHAADETLKTLRGVTIPELTRIVHFGNIMDMLRGQTGKSSTRVDYYGRIIDPLHPATLMNEMVANIGARLATWTPAQLANYCARRGISGTEAAKAEILRVVMAKAMGADKMWKVDFRYATTLAKEYSPVMLLALGIKNAQIVHAIGDPNLAFLNMEYKDGVSATSVLADALQINEQNALEKIFRADYINTNFSRAGQAMDLVNTPDGKTLVFPGTKPENFVDDFAAMPEMMKGGLYGYSYLSGDFTNARGITVPSLPNWKNLNERYGRSMNAIGAAYEERSYAFFGASSDIATVVKPYGATLIEDVPARLGAAMGVFEIQKNRATVFKKDLRNPQKYGVDYVSPYIAVLAGAQSGKTVTDAPRTAPSGMVQTSANSFAMGASVTYSGGAAQLPGIRDALTTGYGDIAQMKLLGIETENAKLINPKINIPASVVMQNGKFVLIDGKKADSDTLRFTVEVNGRQVTNVKPVAALCQAGAVAGVGDIVAMDEVKGYVDFVPGVKMLPDVTFDEKTNEYVIRISPEMKNLKGEWMLGVITRHTMDLADATGESKIAYANAPVAFAFSSMKAAAAGQKITVSNLLSANAIISVSNDGKAKTENVVLANNSANQFLQFMNYGLATGDKSALTDPQANLNKSLTYLTQPGTGSDVVKVLKPPYLYETEPNGRIKTNADGTPIIKVGTDGKPAIDENSKMCQNLKGYTLEQKAANFEAMKAELNSYGTAQLTPSQKIDIMGKYIDSSKLPDGTITMLDAYTFLPGTQLNIQKFEKSQVIIVEVPWGINFGKWNINPAGIQKITTGTTLNDVLLQQSSHNYPIVSAEAKVAEMGKRELALKIFQALGKNSDFSEIRMKDQYGNALILKREQGEKTARLDLALVHKKPFTLYANLDTKHLGLTGEILLGTVKGKKVHGTIHVGRHMKAEIGAQVDL